MRIKRIKENTACLFHDANQADERITRKLCTIYFGFINAKYNGVIKSFTEDQVKEVAAKQVAKGKLSYTTGGALVDWALAVAEYLNCTLLSTKEDYEVEQWLDKGYAVWLGIRVNGRWSKDFWIDGALDELDYAEYKGGMGHATNFIRWQGRGENTASNGEEFVLDSYFVKRAAYKCSIEQILEDVDMFTKYIFLP